MKHEIEVIFYKMKRTGSEGYPPAMQASFVLSRDSRCAGKITFLKPIPDLKFSTRYRLTIEELADGGKVIK